MKHEIGAELMLKWRYRPRVRVLERRIMNEQETYLVEILNGKNRGGKKAVRLSDLGNMPNKIAIDLNNPDLAAATIIKNATPEYVDGLIELLILWQIDRDMESETK